MADTETAQFESDQMLKLLTDALRAGPGSPQWHEAVTRLRGTDGAQGGAQGGADEYRLILQAREDLESGREYRSVRAGPGFTRKVMEQIDQESQGKSRGLPSATILAVLGVLGIVAAVVVVAVLMSRNPPVDRGAGELAGMHFAQPVASGDFSMGVPPEWRTFGLEPARSARGQGLSSGVQKGDDTIRGGGVYLARGMPPADPFATEATIRVKGTGSDITTQLFITDTPMFDTSAAAATPREFAVYLRGGQWNVARGDLSVVGQTTRVSDVNQVVVKMDAQSAVVQVNGQTLYTGPHGLSVEKARYPGLRFLTRGTEKSPEDVVVSSVRILKP